MPGDPAYIFRNYDSSKKVGLTLRVSGDVVIAVGASGFCRAQFARTAAFVKVAKDDKGVIHLFPIQSPVHDASGMFDNADYDLIQLGVFNLALKYGITIEDLGGLWKLLQQLIDFPATFDVKVSSREKMALCDLDSLI